MASIYLVDNWLGASREERWAAAEAAAQALGTGWQVAQPHDAPVNAQLFHRPTSLTFVLVPGGTMTMGLGPAELALLELYLGSRKHILEQIGYVRNYAQPTCWVRVAPFICGTRLLDRDEAERCFPGSNPDDLGAVYRKDALSLAAHVGFRIPSDAELEWLARQGRQSPFVLDCVYEADEDDEQHVLITNQPIQPHFGIADLFETQWSADDWFDTHTGRPTTAEARRGGDPQGVRRFEEFYFEAVGRESVISQLSARRDPGRCWRARVRLALDLPQSLLSEGS